MKNGIFNSAFRHHDSPFFNHIDLNSYFESLNSYFESLNSYFESLNSYLVESLNRSRRRSHGGSGVHNTFSSMTVHAIFQSYRFNKDKIFFKVRLFCLFAKVKHGAIFRDAALPALDRQSRTLA